MLQVVADAEPAPAKPPVDQPAEVPPDPNAGEREAQRERALQYVRERLPDPMACPMGHSTTWTVTEPVQLRPVAGGLFAPTGFPVFQLVCTTCGYTMFFNAVVAGILPSATESAGSGK
jgi:hypothetical protein